MCLLYEGTVSSIQMPLVPEIRLERLGNAPAMTFIFTSLDLLFYCTGKHCESHGKCRLLFRICTLMDVHMCLLEMKLSGNCAVSGGIFFVVTTLTFWCFILRYASASGPAATATSTANCKQFFSGLQIVYKHFCKLNKIFRGACGMWHVACNAGIPIAIATVGSNLEIQETPQQQQRQQQ